MPERLNKHVSFNNCRLPVATNFCFTPDKIKTSFHLANEKFILLMLFSQNLADKSCFSKLGDSCDIGDSSSTLFLFSGGGLGVMSPSVSLESSVDSAFWLGFIAAASCAAGDGDAAGGRVSAKEGDGAGGTNVLVPVIDLLGNFIPGTNLCLLMNNANWVPSSQESSYKNS